MKHSTRMVLWSLCLALLAAPTAQAKAIGGGSDGGGNTYHGKPLESYAVDPTSLLSFQETMDPLLKDILGKKSHDNQLDVLSHLMLSVFRQKIWYFVPGPLDAIPGDLLNSAVRTDQAALQGFDRVWIDRDIWQKMSSVDQGRLLLHETFMGLKILRFASSLRICSAAYTSPSTCNYQDGLDRDIKLTASDYVDVQKATIQTFTQYVNMENADWMQLLAQSNIRYSWSWFEPDTAISRDDLKDLLTKSSLSGYLPTIGYNLRNFDNGEIAGLSSRQELYEYIQKIKKTCGVSFDISGKNLTFQLSAPGEAVNLQIPLPDNLSTRDIDMYNQGRLQKSVSIGYISPTLRPTGGYTFYNIHLGFDFYHLANVYIQEMVCADKNCRTPEIDVKGGLMYVCSDDPYLYKP